MLTALLSYLLLYKYFALFVFVFSIAIVVPLPANGILLAAGAFASFGYFNLWISLIVAVTANVSGDFVDYLIGRKYGPRVFQKFNLTKHYYFERLGHGFRTHAGLTIFTTRFVGSLDICASLFAGSIGVTATKFLLYDFLGNLTSTSIVIVVGYLAGNYWQDFSGLVSIFSWTIFTAIALFLAARIFLRHRKHAALLARE